MFQKILILILFALPTFAQSPFWKMELMETTASTPSTPDIVTDLVALWQNGDTVDVTGRGNDLTRSHTDPTPSPDAFVLETIYTEGALVSYNGVIWRARITTEGNTPEESFYWTHHQPYKTATGLAGIDSAITFNGIDHYLSRASTTDLQFGGTDFTIAVWVKSLTGDILYKDPYFIINSDGENFTVGLTEINIQSTSAPDGEYQLLTAVLSATTAYFYIDAILQNSVEAGINVNTEAPIYIGNSSISAFLNGSIAQLAIYKRALTQEQITYLYNGGDGRLIVP